MKPPDDPIADLAERVRVLERELDRLKGRRHQEQERRSNRRSRAPSALEASVGLGWSRLAGAASLAGAIILAALWAHEQGWVTPAVRYLGGAAAAAAVLCVGMRWALGRRPGMVGVGRAVAFLGAVGLFVVPAAAYRLDGLLAADLAAAATLVVTAALTAAAWRRAGFLASIAVPGAAALGLWWPPLADAPIALLAFLGALGAVATAAQRGAGRADALAVLCAAGFHLRGLLSGESDGGAALAGAALWGLCLAYSSVHRPRLQDQAWRTALTFVAAAAGAGLLFGATAHGPARAALTCALVAAQAALLAGDRRQRAALVLLVAVAVAALASGAGDPSAATAATAASILPLPLWILYVRAACAPGELQTDAYLFGHGGAAIIGLGWAVLARDWNQPWAAAPALASLALLWLLLAGALARRDDRVAASGWALVSSTVAAVAGALAGLAYLPLDRPTGSMLATAAAVVGALGLVATGIRQRTLIPRAAGLLALSGCVVKAVAVDLWYLSPGTRIGALVALGAGLLGASFLYGRWSDENRGTPI